MAITLREIDSSNWERVTELQIADDQKDFVRPNWYSMLQVTYIPIDLYHKAIYHDEEMVGYAMMGQDPDDKSLFVGRLMIDREHQGKGYGRAAMVAIIDDLKSRFESDAIFIHFVPQNIAARKLYESLGFVDTGDLAHGEHVFRMPLK